jgi:hypothetical protein
VTPSLRKAENNPTASKGVDPVSLVKGVVVKL